MTYANIILKQDNDDTNGNKFASKIDPFLALLVEPLALKYPNWEFKESGTSYESHMDSNGYGKKNFTATTFKVFEKREELGTIYVDKYNRQERYGVDNFRIGAMRERGSGMKTIHLKKAMRHVEKYFGKKNLDEKMKDARDKAETVAYHASNELHRQQEWAWNKLIDDAKNFLVSKYWEEFVSFVNPKHASDAENYPKLLSEGKAGRQLYDAVRDSKKDYYLVSIEGMRYSISRANDPIQIKESDELPAFIKRSVGMLKLLEDKQIIGGVGMRVDAETFIVLPQGI